MSYRIDLHGLSHKEAILLVERELILNNVYKHDTIEIITGKSPHLQDLVIEEVIERYNFDWFIPPSNQGILIVVEKFLFI